MACAIYNKKGCLTTRVEFKAQKDDLILDNYD